MTAVPDRTTFESAYAGQAPWDIGRAQKAFLDVAEQITGSILDAGCGTGENALFFAGLGRKVTGFDFLEEPIQRAKRKATERGMSQGLDLFRRRAESVARGGAASPMRLGPIPPQAVHFLARLMTVAVLVWDGGKE